MYSPAIVYNRLARLEKELQRLKVKAYLALPEKSRKASSSYSERSEEKSSRRRRGSYPEDAIINAVKETRENIWQERYAKEKIFFL